jgi:hypothetical protein
VGKSKIEAGALVGFASKPTGLSGRGKSGRNDAAGLANGKEAVARASSHDAAAVRCKELRLEIKGAQEVACWIGEWKSAGPGDKLGWIGGLSRRDELNGAKVHDVVDGVNRESVPLWPPATARVTQGLVRRTLEEELDMIDSGSIRINTIWVGSCQGRVDSNKTPARTSSAFWEVGDKEELVGAGSKSSC